MTNRTRQTADALAADPAIDREFWQLVARMRTEFAGGLGAEDAQTVNLILLAMAAQGYAEREGVASAIRRLRSMAETIEGSSLADLSAMAATTPVRGRGRA